MEINSHSQLLISPSPLLIKTRKLFLKLAGMREVCLIPQSLPASVLMDAVFFWGGGGLHICGYVLESVFLSHCGYLTNCVVVVLCVRVCVCACSACLFVCLHLLCVLSSL